MKKVVIIVVVIALLGAAGFAAKLMMDKSDDKKPAETTQQTHSDDSSTDQATGTTPSPNDQPSASQTNSVSIADFAYSPASITVKKGTTVTWTNNDSVAHTVTSDSGSTMNSPSIAKGETYSVTFNEVGTFSYHCKPHPNMKGTVVVTE